MHKTLLAAAIALIVSADLSRLLLPPTKSR